MGKAKKIGKNRQDKYYHLAKEQGFRSRASFKLIQLNRRHDFLTRAKHGVLDLCAAPGGWMQVARKYIPVHAPVIGVDLVPIKPVPSCLGIVCDITTEQCRSLVKKALREHAAVALGSAAENALTTKVSVVLNDGSPNMGTSWAQDAYTQSELTLASLKLATEFLVPDGAFISKVFRSREYNSLLFVMNQLFKHVNATKPTASRNESAEIYVLCTGYLAPKKIDAKLFEPSYIFKDMSADGPDTSTAPRQKKLRELLLSRRNRDGYDDDAGMLMDKAMSVIQFIRADDPVSIMAQCSRFIFDDDHNKDDLKIVLEMPETTDEIKAECSDLRVLGKKDFKRLLTWREVALKKLQENAPDLQDDEEKSDDGDAENSDSESDTEARIQEAKDRLLAREKRKKRKANTLRVKNQRKIDMKMILPDDQTDLPTDVGLFSGALLRGHELDSDLEEAEPDEDIGATDADPENTEKIHQLKQNDSDLDSDSENYDKHLDGMLNEMYARYLERRNIRKKKAFGDLDLAGEGENFENAKENDDTNNEFEVVAQDGSSDSDDDTSSDSDLESDFQTDLMNRTKVSDKRTPLTGDAKIWFSQPVFEEITGEENDQEDEKKRKREDEVKLKVKKPKKHPRAIKDEEKPTFEEVPVNGSGAIPADEYDSDEKAEIMEMGRRLRLEGKKKRLEFIDDAYNRYAFDDDGLEIPDWFGDEDMKARQPRMPETKEQVEEWKLQMKLAQAAPTRKEMEAKARKKMRENKKLEKARVQANAIAEQKDVPVAARMRQLEQLYKSTGMMNGKIKKKKKKVEKNYVVATATGRKLVGRNKKEADKNGGRINYVDKRMKADKRGMKKAAKKKSR